MASFFRKRPIRYPLFLFMLLGGVASYLLLSDNTLVGLLFALLVAGVSVYSWTIEQRVYEETEKHIETLSYRMKKVGEEALLEMPIGILLINDHYIIEWANPYMMKKLPFDTIIGEELVSISKDFQQLIKNEDSKELTITFGDNNYKVLYKAEERLLYFFDITEQLEIESLYYGDRTVIGVLFIDNYDEIAQGMDDQTRGQLNSLVTSSVNNWGAKYGIFVKRISSDRFLAVFNESILVELEKNKFAILDDIRDTTTKFGFGLTLSVGVGAGSTSLVELGELCSI